MTAPSWIRKLFVCTPRAQRRTGSRQATARSRPAVEALEQRLAPATVTVTNTADALHYNTNATITDLTNHTNLSSGNTDTTITLRDAINAANNSGGSNTITFASGVFGQTITLSSNDSNHPFAFGPTALVIAKGDNLVIAGDPTQAGITLSGGGSHRLFAVYAGASLTLEDLTLTGGKAQGGAGGDLTGGDGTE